MPAPPPYRPGGTRTGAIPLERFLPPIPPGSAAGWIEGRVRAGGWILDPFGASPELALEIARSGRRVLVAANNPIARFILETLAAAPGETDLQTALAHLAAARVGEERLEPHLLDLYRTPCASCGSMVSADEFIWERDAPAPFARVYKCPNCVASGEHPAGGFDAEQATRAAATQLHYARTLERVAALNDPDREFAEEALRYYPPRAVYALGVLVNKLDTFEPAERRLVSALLLTAFDRANTLWPYPSERPRPKQLTIPPRYRERSVFRALEAAVRIWTGTGEEAVQVTRFPELPGAGPGICVFEGRIRDLAPHLPELDLSAVVTALPRPNQAFWTLSALWAGWLGGREAVQPFKSVLRRQRYDWRWHTTALHAALAHLTPHLPDGIAGFALVPEAETGLLAAALTALDRSGWTVDGLALREAEKQAQVHGVKRAGRAPTPRNFSDHGRIREAARAFLSNRGEPSPLLPVLGAVFLYGGNETDGRAPDGQAPKGGVPGVAPDDGYAQFIEGLEEGLTYRAGFLRYNAGKELDTGLWWLRDEPGPAPLADRVETAAAAFLLDHPGSAFSEIDHALCAAFPGLDTPDSDLLSACVESYGVRDGDGWRLRPEDDPVSRKNEHNHNRSLLIRLGERLGFTVNPGPPLTWADPGGRYRFQITTTASFVDLLRPENTLPARRIVVLPGSRANLLIFKRRRDPRLDNLLNDWSFVKFRHLRALEANPLVTRDNIDEQLLADQLTYESPQLNLL
ncbi:MAG TPA: hypothetical protein VMN57_09090 [Anaerolineales bacterium]|nr:hypothetical protein [Anaerolineales bacterium]